MAKSPDAFRTISEVAEWLDRPAHVLRFWESKFTQVKPVKRAGGRRYYRRQDMLLLGGIKTLLHDEGMTIKGVQKLLRENGVKHVTAMSQPLDGDPDPAPVVETAAVAPEPAVDEAGDNLVVFPSPAEDGAKKPAKKKPPFEREPEQAMLFEMADSVAPELDDIYRASSEATAPEVEEPEDVPLPFGEAEARDLPADTDTVATPTASAAEAPTEPVAELTAPADPAPFPGHLTALLDPAARIKDGKHDDAMVVRNRLQDHLTALKKRL